MEDTRASKVEGLTRQIDEIGKDLLAGLFHQEIVEKRNVGIGMVRFVADQLGWDTTWVSATDIELRIFEMLSQGYNLREIRSNIRVNLEVILAVTRKFGLRKKDRQRIRAKRPLVDMDHTMVTNAEIQKRHFDQWNRALKLWDEGIPFAKIATSLGLHCRELLAGIREMRSLYGWFSPRSEDADEGEYMIRRRQQEIALRTKWKLAESYWKAGLNVEEIAKELGMEAEPLSAQIQLCQQIGMFPPQKVFTVL